MVTQQVVLLSRTSGDNEQMSEQVDSPSPPPPPPLLLNPPRKGLMELVPCGLGKVVAVKGSQLDCCEYP